MSFALNFFGCGKNLGDYFVKKASADSENAPLVSSSNTTVNVIDKIIKYDQYVAGAAVGVLTVIQNSWDLSEDAQRGINIAIGTIPIATALLNHLLVAGRDTAIENSATVASIPSLN